ncbi:MAG: hypothetical protein ACPGJS_15170 [Flammeovirgaceae bacterium]
MEIKDIVSQLQAQLTDDKLNLQAIAQVVPSFQNILSGIPESNELTLGGVSINSTTKTITVKGSSPWSAVPLDFEVKLKKEEDQLSSYVTVDMSEGSALSIPNLDFFQLDKASFSFEATPSIKEYIGSFSSNLQLGDVSIPIAAKLPNGEGFHLTSNPENLIFNGIADLSKIVGGKEVLALPEEINSIGNVQLNGLELNALASTKGIQNIQSISLDIGTAEAWELIPQLFELSSIEIVSEVSNPLDKATRNVTGTISGKVKLSNVELELKASKANPKDSWVFTGAIPSIDLAEFASVLLKEFAVPSQLPSVQFVDTQVEINPSAKSYSFQTQSATDSNWTIPLGVTDLVINELSLNASKANGITTGEFKGKSQLFNAQAEITAKLEEELQLAVTLKNVNLTAIVDALIVGFDFPSEVPNVIFDAVTLQVNVKTKELSLTASSTDDWTIPLGVTGLTVEDVQLSIDRKLDDKGKMSTSGSFKGEAALGTVSFDLDYTFPGAFVLETEIPSINLSPALQDLCGSAALIGLPAPSNMLNLSLSDIKIQVAPQSKEFSLSGNSTLGACELLINKNKAGKWGFLVGFAPPANWHFSAIDSSLTVLDELNFSGSGLVLSSAAQQSVSLDTIQVPAGTSIVKGLTFFANLDMSGLGVDDLMSLETLSVSAAIGSTPSNIKLQAGIGGSFKISDSVSMGDMNFFLRPAPSNFELGISGAVNASIGKSDLTFIGTMGIKPIDRSASFAATMLGIWEEPFGVKGLSVADVAMEVGIGIVPPPAVAAPIIGLAGTIGIGAFEGSAAVKFDTAMPSKSMIAASFNQLYLKDIVQTFCEPAIYNQIPKELQNTVLSVGMEDVGVYVVPQPTTIGELYYEAGFKFEGKLSIADFDAQFFFMLDYSKGFLIKASMDPINIEDVFVIAGSNGLPGPSLELDLQIGAVPKVEIAASMRLLGISAETYIALSDAGFLFMVEGKIFDVFEASITASGSGLKSGGDFYLKVEMRNDLMEYLREKAVDAIQDAADSATKAISDAQDDIDKAQDDVDKLQKQIERTRNTIKKERERDTKNVRDAENTVAAAQNKVDSIKKEITAMRNTIKKERERDTKNVRDAENTVASAQATVNSINKDITNTRNTIKKERERDTQRLRDAQKSVSSAQSKVNSLQGEINSTKSRINQLNDDIKKKKKWYNKSPWYKKSYRWAEYSAYAAAKGAEITGLYTKIGGLETGKATANAALEAAKQVVRGIEKAAKTFPIDADPRIVALFTAKETANAGLEVAKQSLKGLQAAIKTFPIDADPRIVALFTAKETANASLEVAKQTLKGLQALIKVFPIDADPRIVALFTAKETANASLEAAKLFLEGVKKSVGGLADVAQFIVEAGLGGLLDVRYARFEGQLNSVKGGGVELELEILLMKKPLDLELAFNFNNPLDGAKALAEKLIDEIK